MRLHLALLLSWAAVACRTTGTAGEGSEAKAVVDEAQFQRSIDILGEMLGREQGYMPFEHRADGCQDRALLMSMALAAEGIPSTAVFVVQKLGGPAIRTDAGDQWGFHVAPMVKLADGVETIIDPVLARGSHIPLDQWLSKMHVTAEGVNISRVEGSTYWEDMLVALQGGVRNDPLLTSFEAMKPFKLRQIAGACGNAAGHISTNPRVRGGARQRQTRLVNEVSRMIIALKQRGKLEDDYPYPRFGCGVAHVTGKEIDGNSGELVPFNPLGGH